METTLKTAPLVEPVVAADAKTHMNIDFATDDTYITTLCVAAREYVEQITNRKLITQHWYAYLDSFPCRDYIELPFGSLQSVTTVKYTDSDGTATTWDSGNYIVTATTGSGALGRVTLGYGIAWPTFTEYPVDAVEIDFKCGYGDAATAVPAAIKHAIKLLIADMYEMRETVVAGVSIAKLDMIDRMLMPYRIFKF